MVSPELARIIEKLKNRPDYRTATMQQMRQGLDALTAAYPPEEGVACDTVDAGGVKAAWITPPGVDRGRVIYYLHGGAYVRGSIASHGGMVSRIAQSASARALLLEYRLGPEHPFPAAVDDALPGHRWLLQPGADPAPLARPRPCGAAGPEALAWRPATVRSSGALTIRPGAGGGGRAVAVPVTRLRRKIEPDPRSPRYLRTVRGRGYVLRPDSSDGI